MTPRQRIPWGSVWLCLAKQNAQCLTIIRSKNPVANRTVQQKIVKHWSPWRHPHWPKLGVQPPSSPSRSNGPHDLVFSKFAGCEKISKQPGPSIATTCAAGKSSVSMMQVFSPTIPRHLDLRLTHSKTGFKHNMLYTLT